MAFKFNEKYKQKKEGTLIVDALNLAFRWKHGANYSNFSDAYLSTVFSIANSYNCDNIIICADKGTSSYRTSIYPEYKADRKLRFADQTEEEKRVFEDFFREYENTLTKLSEHYKIFRFDNVEADDIAAHLVKHKEQYELKNIWLLSSDDDWSLLVQEDVNRFSWRTRKEITIDNWREHYDVEPKQFICFKCLRGDPSDNIKGIKGIGPKRAVSILSEYESVFDIIEAVPIDSRYKYMQELNANANQLLVNLELMDLLTFADDAIGQENIAEIRGHFDIKW
jgi:DNA polymerase-1